MALKGALRASALAAPLLEEKLIENGLFNRSAHSAGPGKEEGRQLKMPRWSLKEGLEKGGEGLEGGLEVFGILSHFRAILRPSCARRVREEAVAA